MQFFAVLGWDLRSARAMENHQVNGEGVGSKVSSEETLSVLFLLPHLVRNYWTACSSCICSYLGFMSAVGSELGLL